MAKTNTDAQSAQKTDFKKLSIADAFKKLNTSAKGLSENDAKTRLKNGYNEINEKKVPWPIKLLAKFYGPIPFMLYIVIIISFFLKSFDDLYIVVVLLVFNGLISFFEERHADNAINLLKAKLSSNARVLRSGKWIAIPVRELVYGDIIRVRLGDIVPADSKIIDDNSLKADQSILTGESLSVKKIVGDIIYTGSTIVEGEATAVVFGTGYNTSYGTTAKLIQKIKNKAELENEILSIVKYLIIADIIIGIIIFTYGFFILNLNFLYLAELVIVLLMASVPVALPAAFTITMAIGAKRLSNKSILITKLDAIEEISTINTLCFDKTGTITEGKLEVKEIFELNGFSQDDLLTAAMLASRIDDNDPIDTAVIRYAESNKIDIKGWKISKFTPFEPKTKSSSAEAVKSGKKFKFIKGAFSIINTLCNTDKKVKDAALKKITEFSSDMYRTIVVAQASDKGKFQLVGIIAFYDKPRDGAAKMITNIKALGINIKMLTGDNLLIAKKTAEEVGIGGNIIDANEIRGKTHDEIADLIEKADGIAEIFPEDKYMIVKVLQEKGYRVGMTGDGINDAPALKEADAGIAVSTATDVAKNVAGIVLVNNSLEVIVDAVKESRKIFERMLTYTRVKITRVIQIILFVMIAFFIMKETPLIAFALILLIFTNDIVNMALSTDNAEYSQNPDKWNVKNMMYMSLFFGSIILLLTLLFIPISTYLDLTFLEFQTFMFLIFVVTDKFLIYSLRNRRFMWSTMPSKWLVISSIIGVLIGVFFVYYGIVLTSLSLKMITIAILLSFLIMIVFDISKFFSYTFFNSARWKSFFAH
jgi:H+-transporting ATPase